MAFTIIGVPIDSVGLGRAEPHGTELAPAALRVAGLDRLGWPDAGDLDVRIPDHERDPATGVVGIDGVLATHGRRARRDRTHHRRRQPAAGARRVLHVAARRPRRRPRRHRDAWPGVRRRSPGPLRRRDLADRRSGRHADLRGARRRTRAVGRTRRPRADRGPVRDRDPRLSRCRRTRRCRPSAPGSSRLRDPRHPGRADPPGRRWRGRAWPPWSMSSGPPGTSGCTSTSTSSTATCSPPPTI